MSNIATKSTMSIKPAMTIGDVARITDTATSTLRYYESIGLLPAPERISGRRSYDASILRQVAAIRRAQDAGWTLAEIKELFYGFPEGVSPSSRWQSMAPQKIEELDALLQRTQRMKEMLEQGSGCGCNSLEECELFETL